MPSTIYHKSTSWKLLLVSLFTSTALSNVVFPTTTHDPTTESISPTSNVQIIAGQYRMDLDLKNTVAPPPACAFSCAGYNTDSYTDGSVPCTSIDNDDEEKLIKCLCTDRPFLLHAINCGFKSCGPAINDALAFGYNICGLYNLTFPPPLDLIRILNVTAPPSYELSRVVENATYSENISPPEEGARGSLGGYWEPPAIVLTTTASAIAAGRTGLALSGTAAGAIMVAGFWL